MAGRREKRWLKSVADPDLVEFFEDSEFDAAEYAKGFYEQREASHAAQRVEKLEGLKRQTEEALRAEVVRNYKAFMLATEEIRSMETGIQTLKDLLASTSATLQDPRSNPSMKTFRSVRLLEPKPTEKGPTGRATARTSGGSGRTGDSMGAPGGAGGLDEDSMGLEGDTGPSRGLKLPEWLDQAPIELEELLLERKHQAAASLIRRVREFAGNVQNATNLGRGVERIFQRVETMAGEMADRLLSEISAANTLTVWGFREHKSNFALLIALGHGEKAAVSFVGERSAMIRRSLRLVEVTADPLSYVGTLSETFFGQVSDAVTAFLKLFCGPSKVHQRRATKTGRSVAFHQVLQGQKDCGTAPFCRLVVWVNEQIDQYALLVGKQIRGVTMGPQKVTRIQSSRKVSGGGGPGPGSGAGSMTGSSSTGPWASSSEEAGLRLGPLASSLFSIVSLMLEEAFAAAARLNTYGFPVGVQLASRLVPDVTHFLSAYVDNVRDNMVDAIKKDAFVATELKLLPPEALASGSGEEERKVQTARLTSSARIMVLEARDVLDYALVLLEPPPPEEETLALGETAAPSASSASTAPASPPDGEASEPQLASYYTRDEFLELQPVIVKSLERLLRTYLKESTTCVRARREDLSSNQLSAAASNLSEIGGIYVPQLGAWCLELLPEISDEEEVASLRALELEFQRSASNPIRPKDPSTSGVRSSSSARTANRPSVGSSTSAAGNPMTQAAVTTVNVAAAGAAALGRASVGASSRVSLGSSVGRLSVVSTSSVTPAAGAAGSEGGDPSSDRNRDPRTSDPELPPSSGSTAAAFAASAAAEAAAAAAAAVGGKVTAPTSSRPRLGVPAGAPPSASAHVRTGSSGFKGSSGSTQGRSTIVANPTSSSSPSSSSSASTKVITTMDKTISSTKKVPAAASRYMAAASGLNAGGGGGSTGNGSQASLPASMRRPTMTLKAARAAAEAKAKAAAEAKAKAATEAKARAEANTESNR